MYPTPNASQPYKQEISGARPRLIACARHLLETGDISIPLHAPLNTPLSVVDLRPGRSLKLSCDLNTETEASKG